MSDESKDKRERLTIEPNGGSPIESGENKEMKKEVRKRDWKIIRRNILIIILIIIIILLLLRSCAPASVVENIPVFSGLSQAEVEEGTPERKTREQIQEELNRKVKEGQMNISMNPNPIFEDNASRGNLTIVNEEINYHSQVVEIYLLNDDESEGEMIYRSGIIPVGTTLKEDNIKGNLSRGVYPAIAYFYSVDDAGNILGKAGAKINITIKN